MKSNIIVDKLKMSELCEECRQFHLTPFIHSKKGGVWQSIDEKTLKELLDDIGKGFLDEETSGWKKHLDRWEAEGKIKKEDRE